MSRIVRYIAHYSMLFGRVHSILSHNVQYCCESYTVLSHSTLCSHSAIQRVCYKMYVHDGYDRALFIIELMMLKCGARQCVRLTCTKLLTLSIMRVVVNYYFYVCMTREECLDCLLCYYFSF